jgi:hypothetical protein
VADEQSRVADVANTAAPESLPVFAESIGGALIDSARISIMAAVSILPAAKKILLADEADGYTVQDCLDEAMEWLDAARVKMVKTADVPPTSLHVVSR